MKKMKSRLLHTIVLMLLTVSAMAQHATIKGAIQFADKKAAGGANVSLKGTAKGCSADDKGLYELTDIKPGSYSLVISYVGYEPLERKVTVKAGETLKQNFVLGETAKELGEVTVSANSMLGSKRAVLNRTGSAYYMPKEELSKFNYTDVNRMLSTVPGVSFFEEDGFGLRPNISLRGSSPSRTSKITVMEDGVLAAPAPYASPAAYYFPTAGRMDAVEILKGSSQIQYGPFTTGGAINFLSAAIPSRFSASLRTSYGSFNTSNLRATVGNSYKYGGYVVDFLKYNSDGFKTIDNQSPKGFDRNDVTAKLRLNTDLSREQNHSLTFKFQYSNENSDETYLGITEEDYRLAPFKRYAASGVDHMKTNHKQFMATYLFNVNRNMAVSATGYYNTFDRNWYKLDKVNMGDKVPSLDNVLVNPEKHADILSVLKGEKNTTDKPLLVKANKRDYFARGVQARINYRFDAGPTRNEVEAGIRYHQDGEDRFQYVDKYDMMHGTMVLAEVGKPGSDANREITAKAFAGYLLYKFSYGKLHLTPGLRYEHITLSQDDYGKKDPDRKGDALKQTENKIGGTFIPGIGVNYRFTTSLSAFGGVHKGFAPPGTKAETKPESSTNYELGVRLLKGSLYVEAVGYLNHYSNMLGSDMAATGGSGTLEQFNAGKADVGGLELLVQYNLMRRDSRLQIPVGLSYTFTDTHFRSEFKSDIWGQVKLGDEIPYIAKHQLTLNAGLEYEQFSLNATGRYHSGFRTVAGSGTIPELQKAGESFVVDLIAKYALNRYVEVSLSGINVLNAKYIASRSPMGVRPGMPAGVYAGLSLTY